MIRARLLNWASLLVAVCWCGSGSLYAQLRLPDEPPSADAPSPSAVGNSVQQTSLARTESLTPTKRDSTGPTVIARVNGEPILYDEVWNLSRWTFDDFIQRSGQKVDLNDPAQRQAVDEQVQRMMKPVLQQMVEREMIMQDAIARIPPRAMDQVRQSAQREIESQINKRKQQLGLRTDEELQVYLSKQGLSLESLKRQVERGMIADEYLRSRMSQKIQAIDREQLLEYYRNNSKLFELPEITWQYIFISNIAGARHLGAGESPNIERSHQHAIRIFELAQKCQTKEDFQKLAESHTDGPVANGDGEGGRRGEIRPREIEEYLYRMQPGQVGATEAANGRGYHIFRVLTKNAKGRKNFEEACPEIRRKIQNEIYSSEREKFLRELKVKTFVKYEL